MILMKKYTIEYIAIFVKKFGFELISVKYISVDKNLILKDKNGYFYTSTITNLKAGKMSWKVAKSNPYTIQNIKLWCKLNNKIFELISEEYEGNDKNLKWKCLKAGCGEEFYASWNHICNRGDECPYCSGHQVCLSNCLATLNPQLALEWHPTLNGDLTPYDVTENSGKHIWWQCLIDKNHKWCAVVADRSNNRGCPDCNKSHGEKKIREVCIFNNFVQIFQTEYNKCLYKNNIVYFIPQKTFDGLVGTGNGLLSYDFYVPKYNLLVEYQGEYHDHAILAYKGEPIELAEARLVKQKEHDRRKKIYALSNNYNLLEIWYWDFDNIETILTEYLNNSSLQYATINK